MSKRGGFILQYPDHHCAQGAETWRERHPTVECSTGVFLWSESFNAILTRASFSMPRSSSHSKEWLSFFACYQCMCKEVRLASGAAVCFSLAAWQYTHAVDVCVYKKTKSSISCAKSILRLKRAGVPHINFYGMAVNYLPVRLTFTDGTDASPGAIVPANSRGRSHKLVALGTSEMDLMSNKVLGAKFGSMSRGFQRRAGGGSCGREKKNLREMLVTCGISLPTSSGILCLRIYTCHLAEPKGLLESNASFTV